MNEDKIQRLWGLSEEQIRRITEWYATPEDERIPKQAYKLAEEVGISPPKLSALKKEIELYDAPPSEVTSFIKTVKKYADSGKNPAWATLYWNIINPAKKEIKEAEFSADDYINIATRVKEDLREELKRGDGLCPLCGRPKVSCN